MEHEMRKYIDTFKERLTENLNISDVRQRFIYLLSSNGYRDSISLDRGSLDIEGLKKLLIDEQKEYFGYDVIEESIKVEDKGTHGWLLFNYKDYDNEIEDGKYGFFKLNVV